LLKNRRNAQIEVQGTKRRDTDRDFWHENSMN
jgi:hypothetical protein